MTWLYRPFAALDFEATGNDPFKDRPVSFCYAIVNESGGTATLSRILNPGVPSNPDAIAVHGITDEMAAAGSDPRAACLEIARSLREASAQGYPLCIMNARFDWTLLLEEGRRYGMEIPTLPILDPGLLDKGCDRYRKGKRKLTDLCALYKVELTNAHDASADAVAAAKLTRAILKKYPRIAVGQPKHLEEWQARVFEEYRAFLCSDGSKVISKGWPVPVRE